MEEYVKILSNILNNNSQPKGTSYLNEYFKIIEKNDNIQGDIEVYGKILEIFEDKYQFNKFAISCKPIMKTSLEKFIAAIVSVNDKNEKIKLIPLIVYLDSENILYSYLLEQGFMDDLKDFLISKVKSIKICPSYNINIPEYNWEVESFKKYKDGIKQINVKDIYPFIDSLNRGRGLIPHYFINFSVFILYKIAFDKLVEIIDNTNDTIAIIFFLNSLSTDEKLKLANKAKNNFLLKFEALREAVYFQKESLSDSSLNEVKKIILCFSKDKNIWEQFLEHYLEYPLRSRQLFKPLGEVLELLDKDKLNTFINKIKIDRYFHNESKEALNNCFEKIENEDIKKEILDNLFDKWVKFVDNYNEYLGELIITNIIDIIIADVFFMNKDTVINNVNIILNNLEEIDNIWFENGINQKNYFYKQMSKLFVYGAGTSELGYLEVVAKIQKFCNNNLELRHEFKTQGKNTLQLFNEYVFKNNSN